MSSKQIGIMACVILAVLFLLTLQDAQAKEDDTVNADQKMASQTGLGKKEIDASKLPGALQYAIVIGSVIATIGVIKFA